MMKPLSNGASTPSKPDEEANVHSGTCLCTKVKYTLTGNKPLEIRVCHCINCKKATGSAFMVNSFWPDQAFTIIQGARLLKAFRDENTASGYPNQRWFCSNCGSNVYLKPTHPKHRIVVVPLGGLDSYVSGDMKVQERTSGNDNLASCVAWEPDLEWFPEQRYPWIEKIRVNDATRNISKLKVKL